MTQIITYKLAMAAAQDAANRQMRKGGRRVWSAGDYKLACREFHRLMGLETPEFREPPASAIGRVVRECR